jgi:hypothetical protein
MIWFIIIGILIAKTAAVTKLPIILYIGSALLFYVIVIEGYYINPSEFNDEE